MTPTPQERTEQDALELAGNVADEAWQMGLNVHAAKKLASALLSLAAQSEELQKRAETAEAEHGDECPIARRMTEEILIPALKESEELRAELQRAEDEIQGLRQNVGDVGDLNGELESEKAGWKRLYQEQLKHHDDAIERFRADLDEEEESRRILESRYTALVTAARSVFGDLATDESRDILGAALELLDSEASDHA